MFNFNHKHNSSIQSQQ